MAVRTPLYWDNTTNSIKEATSTMVNNMRRAAKYYWGLQPTARATPYPTSSGTLCNLNTTSLLDTYRAAGSATTGTPLLGNYTTYATFDRGHSISFVNPSASPLSILSQTGVGSSFGSGTTSLTINWNITGSFGRVRFRVTSPTRATYVRIQHTYGASSTTSDYLQYIDYYDRTQDEIFYRPASGPLQNNVYKYLYHYQSGGTAFSEVDVYIWNVSGNNGNRTTTISSVSGGAWNNYASPLTDYNNTVTNCCYWDSASNSIRQFSIADLFDTFIDTTIDELVDGTNNEDYGMFSPYLSSSSSAVASGFQRPYGDYVHYDTYQDVNLFSSAGIPESLRQVGSNFFYTQIQKRTPVYNAPGWDPLTVESNGIKYIYDEHGVRNTNSTNGIGTNSVDGDAFAKHLAFFLKYYTCASTGNRIQYGIGTSVNSGWTQRGSPFYDYRTTSQIQRSNVVSPYTYYQYHPTGGVSINQTYYMQARRI